MRKHLALTAAIAGLLFATTSAQATEPLELRNVMKELGKNMQTVTDGISREDWTLVEKTSHLIAEHPQPPFTEKIRITSFMGTDMGKFKGFDRQTHKAANEMAKAAQEKDGQKVISSFQKLQSSCLACHQAFRPAFVEHFYGNASN
ncbi:MAG: cytochrome c [Betaproteobacteria bacterium]|nr:cytochrome c [Betaproteobacteria bacterium]